MKNAPLYSLAWKDLAKGFILAVITIILTGLVTSLSAGKLPDLATFEQLCLVGLSAGGSYLIKNFLTDSNDKFVGGSDIKLPMIAGFVLMASFASADTISNADSTHLNNVITGTVNGVISAVPDANVGVSLVKAILIGFGSAITGFFIHLFATKKKK